MFAGIGGFRLGLERAGFECVWSNEWDKYACQTYRKNFGEKELVEDDIKTIDVTTIPEHDLLTGGFPCQSFSFAGKRKGFEDTRGTLFFEIGRLLAAKRPKYCFLENVKGLLSHDNGRTFGIILSTLDELGYDAEWQVLNSKDYRVPQNRERVFIIGHLRGKPFKKVFPIAAYAGKVQGVSETATPGIRNGGQALVYSEDQNGRREYEDCVPTLTTGRLRGGKRHLHIFTNEQCGWEEYENYVPTLKTHMHIYTNERKDWREHADCVPTLKAQMGTGGNNVPCCIAERGRTEGQTFEARKDNLTNSLTSVEKDNYVIARCLDANMHKGCSPKGFFEGKRNLVLNFPCLNPNDARKGFSGQNKQTMLKSGLLRRLTPVECERLQGFPDGWTTGVSDTQRYKQLGNAVTVNVIEAIGKAIKAAEKEAGE